MLEDYLIDGNRSRYITSSVIQPGKGRTSGDRGYLSGKFPRLS